MNTFIDAITNATTIAITGHIHPDGDCIGSCLGVWNYINDNFSGKKVDVYLESLSEEFRFLKGSESIHFEMPEEEISYDLMIILDCGDETRFEPFQIIFEHAKDTFCVDHHISNDGLGNHYVIDAGASATSEILYELMEHEKISLACAECLYTGIIHDTGVFKHSNTTKKTMYIAGDLVDKGVSTSHIIDDTFYRKTYLQNMVMGYALMESTLVMDGKVIYSMLTKKWMDVYGVTKDDLNGIIDQLRITEGVEVAIFIYEMESMNFKVSMRSNDIVDVSKIASYFGGGGHVRAAGCSMKGNQLDVINNVLQQIEQQLQPSEE